MLRPSTRRIWSITINSFSEANRTRFQVNLGLRTGLISAMKPSSYPNGMVNYQLRLHCVLLPGVQGLNLQTLLNTADAGGANLFTDMFNTRLVSVLVPGRLS